MTPSSAVIVTVTVFKPVTKPSAPVTTLVAATSLVVTATVTAAVNAATSTTSPGLIVEPLTVKLPRVASVEKPAGRSVT